MLHGLVVQFMRLLMRRVIAVRELDFALRAHTKVWRLGDRVVRPPHVRHALELSGGARLSKRVHFEGLLERFSGDGDGEDGAQDDEGVPLAVRARTRKGKAVARNEQEGENHDNKGKGKSDAGVREGEQQQQKVGPSKRAQVHEAAELRWSTNHRAMYVPFVYAPDMIAPAHPFGVYAPGTTPEPLCSSTYARHVMDKGEDEDEVGEREGEFMPAETDDEALAVSLLAEDALDEADALADAAYEASMWRELRGGQDADVLLPGQVLGKRRACEEVGGDDVPLAMPARKQRKKNAGGGRTPVDARASAGLVKSLEVKSAAVIEDSDLEYLD